MNRLLKRLPLLVTLLAVLLLLLHGPIAQPARYHDFADTRSLPGLPNAADVLSNIGFALVGIWGLVRLWPMRRHPVLAAGWTGYRLFLLALILTAAGSCFYHLAPDNMRLVWDRIPIALACVGLLNAVHRETNAGRSGRDHIELLALAAVLSVAWWYFTGENGDGDLRPYLLLQGLPVALIPLWQYIHRAGRADRLAFGLAIALYVAAKITELQDDEIFSVTGWISGHTVKHLLATTAAAVITVRLTRRVKNTPA